MKQQESGVRLTKNLDLPTPLQRFLAEGLDACLRTGLMSSKRLADRFLKEYLVQVCTSQPDFAQLIVTTYWRLPASPDTQNVQADKKDFFRIMACMALEQSGVTVLELAGYFHGSVWAKYTDPDRLWYAILLTNWWQTPEADPQRKNAEKIARALLDVIIRHQVCRSQDLFSMLGGEPEILRRLGRGRDKDVELWLLTKELRVDPGAIARLLTRVYALDELHINVFVPLANKFNLQPDRFFEEEIPTSPLLEALPDV